MKNKIPKDLSRWLKDNNKYVEFIRLVTLCGYRCEDLLYKIDGDYGIKKWLTCNNETKYVDFMGKAMRYSDFLDNLNFNWK
jgi:hypothetical protein